VPDTHQGRVGKETEVALSKSRLTDFQWEWVEVWLYTLAPLYDVMFNEAQENFYLNLLYRY
jgi:hypothetical protein